MSPAQAAAWPPSCWECCHQTPTTALGSSLKGSERLFLHGMVQSWVAMGLAPSTLRAWRGGFTLLPLCPACGAQLCPFPSPGISPLHPSPTAALSHLLRHHRPFCRDVSPPDDISGSRRNARAQPGLSCAGRPQTQGALGEQAGWRCLNMLSDPSGTSCLASTGQWKSCVLPCAT